MNKSLSEFSNLSVREQCSVLDVLVEQLETGSLLARRESRAELLADLCDMAARLRTERESLARQDGAEAAELVVEAVYVLARLYEGRDAGLWRLH